jgi:hypothetical protein
VDINGSVTILSSPGNLDLLADIELLVLLVKGVSGCRQLGVESTLVSVENTT